MASVWRACVSFAAPSPFIKSWKNSDEFLGTEETILYGSCFDANGGLFETLLGVDDAVISDELNHAVSLTAFGFARRSGIATKITTWPIWAGSWSKPMTPVAK